MSYRSVKFSEISRSRATRHTLELLFVLAIISPHIAAAQEITQEYTGHAKYDPGMIDCAVGALFQLIEGSFGALIMVVSGLGAIVSAALGAYRAAVGMLVVAVGAFILRSLVALFFGSGYIACDLNE